MTHYRFYRLDVNGKIVEAFEVECADDGAAHVAAQGTLANDTAGEIWAGTRFVGRVPTRI